MYFAYNKPYTYTMLNEYLDAAEKDAFKQNVLARKQLCRTLAGNRLELLTITNPSQNKEEIYARKGVVLTARIHPGETVSSWVMQGCLDFLLSDCAEAHELRENFIFKIVPMLNPDGVVHGNYRCSLSGCDLNRRWKNPSKSIHPEIYFTKRMILDFHQKNKIAIFADLHGHSRKKNVFAYGCHNRANPFESREFPFILSKVNPHFSFLDSNFCVQKNKEGTARVAVWRHTGIHNIFTIESSFCGPKEKNVHFNSADLVRMGSDICRAILIHFDSREPSENESQSPSSDLHIKIDIENDEIQLEPGNAPHA